MPKHLYLLVFSLAFCWPHHASAQSTIFNYQGRLAVNGTPANGLYDFRFTIYKVQTNGLIIAGPLTNTAVAVSGGLFITSLDFGHDPFLGVNRWMDIAVRTNGSTSAFSTLSPRIRIASAPYAIAAANVIDGAVTATALSPGPGADGQVLKMSNGVLTWGTFGTGGTVTSVASGSGLLGGPITLSGTLSIDPTVVPFLSRNQTFTGSNTFNGVSTFANANNKFIGAFSGDGSGLTNLAGGTATNVSLGGDVTGSASANTVARIRGVNVSATAPTSGQLLRFNGLSWTAAPVGLSSDVSGTLGVANGGTGASTPAAGRANLGAAASGANVDITSLSGLTTPLAPAQGGSGQSSYIAGDVLYASSATTLGRRSIGTAGQVLSVSNGLPTWGAANNHNHFGQVWTGVASDGLLAQNNGNFDGVSGLTGVATAPGAITIGVLGEAASSNGSGVQGYAYSPFGTSAGVYGQSVSTNGTGVYGIGSSPTGVPVGVYGQADAPFGIGVYGVGSAATGVPVGVLGEVAGTNGYGFYTTNRLYVGSDANIIKSLSAGAVYVTAASAALPGISFISSPRIGLFNPATNILGFATAGIERVRIAADGKVGIGRTPLVNRLEVEGDASKTSAGGWAANSDARIKTGVQNLEHALETIERVRPVSFRYTDEYRAAHPSLEDKKYINVIAQEFAKVFPDAVKESGEILDGKPILQVDVHPAAIYAIAAIQELHGLVKAKDAELSRLKEQNTSLESRLQALEKVVNGLAR